MKLSADILYRVQHPGTNLGRYQLLFGGSTTVTVYGSLIPAPTDAIDIHVVRRDTEQPIEAQAIMLYPYMWVTGLAGGAQASLMIMAHEREVKLQVRPETPPTPVL